MPWAAGSLPTTSRRRSGGSAALSTRIEYTHQFLHSKGTRNYRGYKNAELDKLLEAARGELVREKRGELYRQALKIAAADCPVFTCFYSNQTNIWTKRLEGFQSLPYAAFGS